MKRTLFLVATFIAAIAGATTSVSAAETISDSARAQIQALQAEKAARTPPQQKMDSQLVYALKQSRNEVIAAGVPQLHIGAKAEADGRILVDITATVSQGLLDFIQNSGGQVVNSVPQFQAIRARFPLARVEALAARPDMSFVRPAVRAFTRTGSVTSQGDVTHRAAEARQAFNANGSGVKVGVLSDSVDYLAISQASGDLPPNVIVLPGQSGIPANGEGTAMLEIVYDLAPGAQLYYASGFNGEAQFAQNILDLRAAGCDVIIDDIGYFDESPFQDSIVARAVNSVTASGALYFSAAGNEGNKKDGTSGTWEGDFVDGGAAGTPVNGKGGVLHSFGATPYDTITAIGFATVLHWSDPLAMSTNDYDLFVLDSTGANIVSSSTTIQNGTQDPYEIVQPTNANQRIVVVKADAAAPRFLHIDTLRGELSINTDGNITGHAAATNAFAVAAVDVSTAFPNPFSGGALNPVETFSTDGPRRVFYHADGTPITPGNFLATGGYVRAKPDITAADGVSTTLPPFTGLNPFFGTSAAAPHAGAIAALLMSYNPILTPADIRTLLTNTALDIEAIGYDFNAGAGIVMAYQALLGAPVPGLSLLTQTVLGGNDNGVIDPNECDRLQVVLRNGGVTNFNGGTATLSTPTVGVTIGQPVVSVPFVPAGEFFTNFSGFQISTTPDFACGRPVQFTLAVNDNVRSLTNKFRLNSGFVSLNPGLLNNNTHISIPDNNTNGVDSTINVSGMNSGVGKVAVSLHITHPLANDLTLQLIGPDGTTVNLARGRGLFGANYGSSCTPFSSRTTFDDNAPNSIVVVPAPFPGFFRPEEPLSAFAGKVGAAVNGVWRLRVIDQSPANTGAIECWTLSLFPSVCTDGGGTCTSADLALSASASPAPALRGLDLTYTVVIANGLPATASPVVLTNVLPANVTFVSATSSQGSCTLNGGTVLCNLGTLASGSNASATIVVRPVSIGTITSVFSVGSATPDSNPANNVAQVVSTVIDPTAVIVAAGAQLVAESAPPTGGIEAGETVTVNLGLRNTGSAATANLIATLQAANGVSAPSGPQNYGAIAAGAVSTQPFTFTASGAAGSTISAVLNLQDGVQNLGTVTFNFTIGGEVTIENVSPITINQLGAASPYPATINVSGVVGLISKVRVTFTKLTHSYPDDIDALLVGPRGQKIILMSDCGGGNAIVNRTLTFDSAAASKLPDESLIATGSYLPSDYVSGTEPGGDVFPAPAPVGSLATSLLAFNSTDPNGTWSLFINDDGGIDGGAVAGGWSLAISTVVPLNSAANLAIAANAAPNPAIVGEALTYTLTVANLGPSNVASVVVNNTIPANSSFVSASVSSSFAAGVVTLNLGNMNSGAIINATVTVTPNSSGLMTNSATVSGASADLDLSNNTATTIVIANTPVADLAVSATAAPNPVFVGSNLVVRIVVTNRGPDTAPGVTLFGDTLPSGHVDIGTVGNGSAVTLTLTQYMASAGLFTNSFLVRSLLINDPVASNDAAQVVTTVLPPAPLIVAAGAALTAETPPANGAIEPGELVTLAFGLRNVGSADTTDLIATLLATGGVTSPGDLQHYGVLAANGSTVSRPFAFIATGAPGSTLTATLQLQDGAQSLGTVSFSFTLSASAAFTNGNVIIIPDHGQATNYPATLAVSGVTGSVTKVTVTLNQLTHSYPDDIDMLLVGPGGEKAMLMSDVGAGVSIANVTLTFDDAAAPLPSGAITSGTYHPTDNFAGDTFPAPAPAGPYGANLSVFSGTNPNGTWSLYVVDDAAGDQGRINGWTLNIQTAAPVPSAADVSLAVTAPANAESSAPFSYAITVANDGPAAATDVILNDTLPAGFILGSVTVSQGSYSTGAGTVTANLGALVPGASAAITISGAGVGPRAMTNLISVTAVQTDLNLANNSAAPVTRVAAPLLAIRRSGTDAVITWAAPSTGYTLESSVNSTGPWAASGAVVTTVNGTNSVTVPATGTSFFRLRKP